LFIKILSQKEKNFEFRDWKSFIGSYFNECRGIRSWHINQIEESSENILVAEHVLAPLCEYKIINSLESIIEEPSIIEPEPLSENRLTQLKVF